MGEHVVRVFVSSPNDVGYERARAERVAQRLQGLLDGLTIEIYRWEEGRYFSAHDGFQQQIPLVETFDIVLGILWSRVGSPLPPDFPRMRDGRPYPSGTAFEILTAIDRRREGKPLPDVLIYRKTAPLELSADNAANQQQTLAQVATLNAFMAEWLVNEAEGFKGAFKTFLTPDQFEAMFEVDLRAWLAVNRRLGRERVWRVEEKGSPFRGLDPFGASHRDVFFGRRADVERARERLDEAASRGCAALLIEGASGTGKSSIARAGLVPRLRDIDPLLRVATFKPGDGASPLHALAKALHTKSVLPELAAGDFPDAGSLVAYFRGAEAPQPILRALDRAAEAIRQAERRDDRPTLRLLLLVDQLEEVFGQSVDKGERAAFARALLALARSGWASVICTLRLDARGEVLIDPSFATLINDGATLSLSPPGADALDEIVRGPARAAALAFERRAEDGLGLDEILIAEAGGLDALPLLQFTLGKLYDAEAKRLHGAERRLGDVAAGEPVLTLRLADHAALGGIAGAIRGEAEAVWKVLDTESTGRLPRLVRALIEPVEAAGEEAPRRVLRAAPIAEAAPDVPAKRLVDALVEARILTRDGETVRFTHEKALSAWDRAAKAAGASARFLRVRAETARAEARWRDAGKPGRRLLTGVALAEAMEVLPAYREEVAAGVRTFVDASRRRARRGQAVTALAACIFAAFAGIAGWQYLDANAQRQEAVRQAEIAEKNRRKAEDSEFAARRAAEQAIRNESVALAALSDVARREGRGADALRLALASWPRNSADTRPALARSLQAMGRATAEFLPAAPPLLHEDAVTAVAFSPDGTRVVTTASGGMAWLWGAATGTPLGVPLRHEREVIAVAFSLNGAQVVTASKDGAVRRWDAETGAAVGEVILDLEFFLRLVISPDGTRLVTTSASQARLWDVATGAPLGAPMRHEGVISSVAFNPNGSRVVTASFIDRTARLWDAATGAPLGAQMRHEGALVNAAFSPNGVLVVTTTGREWRLWDAVEGSPLGAFSSQEGSAGAAAFSPDGERVVTASSDGTARLWVTATMASLGATMRHEREIADVAFSPDGARVVTASYDGTARLWDAATGAPLGAPIRHEGAVTSAAFTPDGARVVTASEDGTTRLWDTRTGTPLGAPLHHGGPVLAATFSSDGAHIVTAGANNAARLWDGATGAPLSAAMRHQGAVMTAAFSPDRARVLTASLDGTAQLWDAATGTKVGPPMRHDDMVNAAEFSHDGGRVVTASFDGTAQLWDAATGAPLGAPMRHEHSVNAAAFSPDRTRVITASFDGTARLWDAATGAPLAPPMRHGGRVYAAAFSSDGSRLVTASTDHMARLWHAATGAPLGAPMRHGDEVHFAAFSRDGARVVTASIDGTARLWDGMTGAPLVAPMRHRDAVYAAAFSPDGARIVTASRDRTAQLWDAATGAPLGEPMRHGDDVHFAAFSPDGTRVLTGSRDQTARLWNAQWPSGPIPAVACALLPEIRVGRGSVDLSDVQARYGISITEPICEGGPPPFDPQRIVD